MIEAMAAGRGQLSGQAQADTSRLHAIGFSPFAALSCALVLAGACLLDLPASAQVPSERPERGRAAPLEERSGRRGNRGPVEEFRTQVPSRPYDIVLGNPTETSVTASIVAYSTLEGYFEYGTDPGGYDKRSELVRLEPNVAVEAILDGLVPHAQHWYRWRSRASPRDDFEASGGFTFRSGRAQGETFVFTVQADSHLDGRTDTRLYEASLRNARLAGPDFHVDLGDTFMTDKRRTDYRDALPQYLAQRYYFGLIGSVAPVFLVSGNHDGEGFRKGAMGRWARKQRDAYFATPSDGVLGRGNYYSWEWGDALFVALDPFWETDRVRRGGDFWARTLGESQFRWLAQTLRSSRARFKFVFVHHLVGGLNQAARGGAAAANLFEWGGRSLHGKYEFDERRPGWEMPIHQMLVETGVDIVFHGHDHAFVKEDLDGLVYLLVPQPGLGRYGVPRDIAGPYENGDIVGGPGHVRVTVSPEAALVELVQTRLQGGGSGKGRVAYSFRARLKCSGECQ
ncbi:MAG: metallophosphoesterase [Acidobacteriia bacterium]|nr:metallophosphoesterase [Terriglobia bacterium]MYK10052.1 metallophosphoesterase [Terriglobia bacterium]